ncbi:MAG: uracil-DNA glycosylase [Clostridiales bacterium]|nr:uracil-DNA glycosylase [Clostridiales bacterium]
MNIREELERRLGAAGAVQLCDAEIDPAQIRALLINEIVPADPSQDFYGSSGDAYLSTALPLLRQGGLPVESIGDALRMGVYITNAVKIPKETSAVPPESIELSLPWLEQEIALFPNLRVIMLCGDVAKKMFNRISRKAAKRNVIPSGATYKLRAAAYYHGSVRVIPSYIITGGNLLIEKSKTAMIAQDIAAMAAIIR